MPRRQAPEENTPGLFAALKQVTNRVVHAVPKNPVVPILSNNRTALPAQPQFPPQIPAETPGNLALLAKFPGLDALLRN